MNAPALHTENAVAALGHQVAEILGQDPGLRMEHEALKTLESLKRILEDAEANPKALAANYHEIARILGDGCSIIGELARIAVKEDPTMPHFIII